MGDLNSKIHYKVQFDIERTRGEEKLDALWELLLHIKRWLDNKYAVSRKISIQNWTRFKYGSSLSCQEYSADSKYRINPDDDLDISWACYIKEWQYEQGFAPRCWVTEIGYQSKTKDIARISFVVSYSDAMGFIGEIQPEPDISVPNIVKNIQGDERFECSLFGKDPIHLLALPIAVGGGMALRDLIFDSERMIPIVLIMPKNGVSEQDKIVFPVNPDDLAKSVAGNALVYYSEDMSFVNEMRYILDSEYRCAAGAIRLYLPHVNPSNPADSNRHRFIHFDDAVKMGEDAICRIFRRVLAQDINDYDSGLFRVKNCEDLIRRDEITNRIRAIKNSQREVLDEKDDSIEALKGKNKTLSEQLEEVTFEKMEVEDELSSKDKEIFNLNAQVESLTFALKPLSAKKEGYDYAREMSEYPSNPIAVVKFFSSVFPDRIAITEKGWKSLDDCRTDASVLWDALFSIVSILYDELESSDNFSEACANYSQQAPFECSVGNSSTTNRNSSLDKQYVDYYEGKEISIKPHIKKGSNPSDGKFLRIYFCFVRERAKIVIGTIGKHLDTAGTMYQK